MGPLPASVRSRDDCFPATRPGAAPTTGAVVMRGPGSPPPPDPDARFRPEGSVPADAAGRSLSTASGVRPGRVGGDRNATVAIMCSPSTTSLLALRFDYDRRRQAGGSGTTSPLCTNTDQLTDPANVPASGGKGQSRLRGCLGDNAAARSCRPGSAPAARLHAIARVRFVGYGYRRRVRAYA
jgi:hypothetical protein